MKFKVAILLLALILLANCGGVEMQQSKKMLILGIDGMDPRLLKQYIAEGKMPAFKKLVENGSFKDLYSSIPPQSPVAWSNFITGKSPGEHGIFDFVHRESESMEPYLSTSKTTPPSDFVSLGPWQFPLESGGIELLREEDAFWQILEREGVPSTIVRIPSNFPPAETTSRTLSGMGTPDIFGTYGEFSYYTDDVSFMDKKMSGGKAFPVSVSGPNVKISIVGPENFLKKDMEQVKIPVSIVMDKETGTALVEIQGKKQVLKVGELSDWFELEFELVSYVSSIKSICKVMLIEMEPNFRFYVTPLQIHPGEPAMQITTPPDFAAEMAEKSGLYYTQGMAEDTKAFEFDVFSLENYLTQTRYIMEEQFRMYDDLLEDWDSGVFFYYFSVLDQNTHMLWWQRDPNSPIHDPAVYEQYGDLISTYYMAVDSLLDRTMEKIDDDVTLMVMSDHGFAPFYKKFNLNSWLYENGYIKMSREWNYGTDIYFQSVDWSETSLYGLGINGLYVNMKGREPEGSVEPIEKKRLLREVKEKLLATKDPETGENIIKNVYIMEEYYPDSDAKNAPDIIVGYARGYRCSDDSAMGEFSKTVFTVNLDKWSGDHCMDYYEVPGILITNKPVVKDTCYLTDITPTILSEYKVISTEKFEGSSFFK